jgi:tRNA modification GTPase
VQARWTPADAELFRAIWPQPESSQAAPAILVANKQDAVDEDVNLEALPVYCHKRFDAMLAISAVTGANLKALERAVEVAALEGWVNEGKGRAWTVNERQAAALVGAHESLLHVSESVDAELPLDFWTIDLRAAVDHLGEVTGDAVTEEILDTVFSKFCIGK